MTDAEFRALCLSFPDTVEGRNMSSTFFKTNGKDLARLLDAGRCYFTGVPIEEIEMLVEAEPDTFWADNHYKQARCVIAQLDRLTAKAAETFLGRRFRQVAKKAVLKAWEAER
ncbi:MAG: hypothetical protein DI570_10170 [Phenylobacterium zucineum]|nr:MAG: hypothetical protein DI570_10170 [Phenylobacterium zucineum]